MKTLIPRIYSKNKRKYQQQSIDYTAHPTPRMMQYLGLRKKELQSLWYLRPFFMLARFLYKPFGFICKSMLMPGSSPRFSGISRVRLKELREILKKGRGGRSVGLKTPDGVILDAMYFQAENLALNDPTIIYFSGNRGYYEIKYDLIGVYLGIRVNVFVFNYRQFGASGGEITRDGTVVDGLTALQYVHEELRVPYDKILLDGVSMGGGIASEVARCHPSVHFANRESFSSLSAEVLLYVKKRLEFYDFAPWVISIIARIAVIYTRINGWDFRSQENWSYIKGHKWVIHHPQDGVVFWEASLYKSLLKQIQQDSLILIKRNCDSLDARGNPREPHITPMVIEEHDSTIFHLAHVIVALYGHTAEGKSRFENLLQERLIKNPSLGTRKLSVYIHSLKIWYYGSKNKVC